MMDIEKMIEQFRTAADKWETGHQIILTGELRVQDALRAAATALSALQIEKQALRNAANGFKAENTQLRRRLSEAVSECSRIQEWAQNTGHDYAEGIARDFLDGEGNRP